MRYIKKFENIINPKFRSGDYIISHINIDWNATKKEIELINYLNNNIGQIPFDNNLDKNYYLVYYDVKPNKDILFYFKLENDKYMIPIEYRTIIAVSKNKEDLELKLAANKYNL